MEKNILEDVTMRDLAEELKRRSENFLIISEGRDSNGNYHSIVDAFGDIKTIKEMTKDLFDDLGCFDFKN